MSVAAGQQMPLRPHRPPEVVTIRPRLSRPTLTGVSLAVAALILILHYTAVLHAFNLHDLLRRLFYLPVITAAIAGGMRGGLVTAGLASLGYLPHLVQLESAGDRVLDHVLDLLLLPMIGLLVGRFADASRRARSRAAECGRLAGLGEAGLALMAQAEGPLAAIEGQTECLRFLAQRRGDGAAKFAAGVIDDQATLIRRLLKDIQRLGQAGGRRPTSVNLVALISAVAGEIDADSGPRLWVSMPRLQGRVSVHADGRVLAHALRSLLHGLRHAVHESGHLEVRIADQGCQAMIVISVISDAADLPDLEESLRTVLDPAAEEYHFNQALSVHLLTTEGASVEFRRTSTRRALVFVRFGATSKEDRGWFFRVLAKRNGGLPPVPPSVIGKLRVLPSIRAGVRKSNPREVQT